MELKCPACENGELIENEKVFNCSESKYDSETQTQSGCQFKIWKSMFGATLTKEEVISLLNNETIEKTCVSKQKGTEYQGLLTLDLGELKINLTFPEAEEDENGIKDFGKGYSKNGMTVWKKMSGENITKEDAIQLFNGETIRKENLLTKAGKEFKANLTMNLETGKVEYEYDK